MSIIRRRRNRNYTVVGNGSIEDERLSYEALGLLTYLLSRPDDWCVRQDQLRKRGGVGKEKLRRIIEELITAGYIVMSGQVKGKGGKFTTNEYVVFDEPQQLIEDTTSGGAVAENPPRCEVSDRGRKPATDRGRSAAAENQPRPIYKDLPNTDLPNSDRTDQTDRFSDFWSAYPRNENRRQAEVEFNHAVAEGADPDTVIAGARAYAVKMAKQGRESKFIKLPAGWLADRLWQDEDMSGFVRNHRYRTITKHDPEWQAMLEERRAAGAKTAFAEKYGSFQVPVDYAPSEGAFYSDDGGKVYHWRPHAEAAE